MPSAIERAVELLRHSTHAVALTGAGISTPSGIPDFRGTHSGLWNQIDPLEIASIWAYHDNPQMFYQWLKPVFQKALVSRPNAAHTILAGLERKNLIKAVITQNIDSLHQRAGSQRVLELHGNTRTATCLTCGHQTSAERLWASVLETGSPAPCLQCNGLIKPDVVLFGEPLPYDLISTVQCETLACDVMLVIGTSLEVMPAADLPLLAKRRGARVILVNRSSTALDDQADIVVRSDVVKALRQMWRRLET